MSESPDPIRLVPLPGIPLVAVVIVGAKGQLTTQPGPEAQWSEVTQNLGWLLICTVFAAGLLNAVPVTANRFSPR